MYTLMVQDHLSALVKITRVRDGQYLGDAVVFAEATVLLSSVTAGKITVTLMALDTQEHLMVADDDFVERRLKLDVGGACKPDAPYARHTVCIKSVWFSDQKSLYAVHGVSPVLVLGEGKLFDMSDAEMCQLIITRTLLDL